MSVIHLVHFVSSACYWINQILSFLKWAGANRPFRAGCRGQIQLAHPLRSINATETPIGTRALAAVPGIPLLFTARRLGGHFWLACDVISVGLTRPTKSSVSRPDAGFSQA